MPSLIKQLFSKQDNLKGQAKVGSVWASMSQIVLNFVNFLTVLILMRYYLGPEEFGIVGIVMLLSEVVRLFTLQGISDTIIYVDDEPEKTNTLFYMIMALGVLVSLGFFFGAPYISGFYKQDLNLIFKIMAFNYLIIAAAATPSALLRKHMRLREDAAIQMTSQFTSAAVTLILAHFRFGVYALIGGMTAKQIVILLMGFSISRFRPQLRFSVSVMRSLLSYIKYVTGEAVVMFVLNRSDQMIVPKFFSPAIFGFYSQAFNFINYPLSIARMTFHTVLFSVFSRMQKDIAEVRRIFININRHIATLFIPLFMGFGILSDLFIHLFLGDKWLGCVPYIYVFTGYALTKIVGVTLPQAIKSAGKPQHLFYYNLIRIAVLIPLLLWLVHFHKPLWVAMGMVGVLLVFKPAELVMLKQTIGVEFKQYFSIFIIPLGASMFMCGGMMALRWFLSDMQPSLLFAVSIIAGMFLYAGFSLIVDRNGSVRFINFIKSYFVSN